jgi:hypothetical protein
MPVQFSNQGLAYQKWCALQTIWRLKKAHWAEMMSRLAVGEDMLPIYDVYHNAIECADELFPEVEYVGYEKAVDMELVVAQPVPSEELPVAVPILADVPIGTGTNMQLFEENLEPLHFVQDLISEFDKVSNSTYDPELIADWLDEPSEGVWYDDFAL